MTANINSQDEIRLLLALFYLGGQDISQTQWLNIFKRKSERISDLQKSVASLQEENSVKINVIKSRRQVSLLPAGKRRLAQALADGQLSCDGIVVSTKFAKALLQWIKSEGNQSKVDREKIDSYPEFKKVSLKVYDRLNQDFKYGNLVPIYQIRRQIGEAVDRSQFDEWLLEMQADDILQLLEGSVEDSAQDKMADSIRTELSGFRCYAKKIQETSPTI
jgi:hypothetical protein